MLHTDRVKKLQEVLKDHGLDAIFLGPSADVQYLADLKLYPDERTKGIMIPVSGQPFALVPQMYTPEIKAALGDSFSYKIWADHEGFMGAFKEGFLEAGLSGKKIAINRGVLAVELIDMKSVVDFTESNGSEILSGMRSAKDAVELGYIKKASEIADEVMEELSRWIRPGMTEREIKEKILKTFKDKGAEGPSFPPIVATGANSAVSHYGGEDGVVKTGDFVKIDIGCIYKGYCSDTARTFCMGEPTAEQRKVYEIVREAQQAGEDAIRPGATGQDADRAARKIIVDAGYGDGFTHRLGHGIGIEVHEGPYVIEGNDVPLKPGNIFSVEPSISIPGKFAVQIENLVVVGEDGYGIAYNKFPREMTVIK